MTGLKLLFWIHRYLLAIESRSHAARDGVDKKGVVIYFEKKYSAFSLLSLTHPYLEVDDRCVGIEATAAAAVRTEQLGEYPQLLQTITGGFMAHVDVNYCHCSSMSPSIM